MNSIPSRASMEIDVRDIDGERRDQVLNGIQKAAEEIASRRHVGIQQEILNADPPAQCAPLCIEALESACRAHRRKLPADDQPRLSRLALHVAHRAHRHAVHPMPRRREPPAGNLFTRKRVAQGSLVLAEALKSLAS